MADEERAAFFKARSEKARASLAVRKAAGNNGAGRTPAKPAPRALPPAPTPVPAVAPEPAAINFSICYEEGETLLLSNGQSIAELRRALWMLTAMLNGRE